MPKIRRSSFLWSFLLWLFDISICARYFVIIVPPFKLIVVSLMFFLVVSEKLFSHDNHVSLLVCNLIHQLVRVFCGHPMKVNFNKRLIHSFSHLQAQQHVSYRSRICVHRSERFSSFSTRRSLLILELSQKFISLIESCLLNLTMKI